MFSSINNKPYYCTLLKYGFALFLALGAITFVFFSFNSSQSLQLSFFYHNKIPKDELGETLERISMPNKTIIIAVVNRAYVEGKGITNMLDLFLEGLWEGEGTRELVNHLLIVAVDQTAYERCRFRGLHCYRLVTDGVDFMGEKVFMSSEFIKMMWRRTLFLLDILIRGYNFVFTDTDVMMLRNPFTVLTTNTTQDLDIRFSTDRHNGDSTSSKNPINTGFYFVRSNNKTISLFNRWYGLKDNSTGSNDQVVLQTMISQGVLTDLKINFRILETKLFSGFCQDSSDARSVITVHANCCRFINAKVIDLVQVLHDWRSFKMNHDNSTYSFRWSRHIDCDASWSTSVANGTS